MNWIKTKGVHFILIFVNILFILSVVGKAYKIQDFHYIYTAALILVGIGIYGWYNFVLRKKRYQFLFTLMLMLLAGLFYSKYSLGIINFVKSNIVLAVIKLNDLIYEGQPTYFHQYKYILIMGIPLLVSLITWITIRFANNFVLVINLTMMICLWYWRYTTTVKEHLSLYVFISIATAIVNKYIKRIRQLKNKGIHISVQGRSIFIYCIIVAYVFAKVISILPQHYEGKDTSRFGEFFNNQFSPSKSTKGRFDAIKGKYDLAYSGYSDNNNKLGGPIRLSYAQVLTVESKKPYYLKGSVKDFYDGFAWEKSNNSYVKKQKEKGLEELYRYSTVDKQKLSIQIKPMEILRTTSYLTPNFAYDIHAGEKTIYYDPIPTFISSEIVTKPYTIDFYELKGYPEVLETVSKRYVQEEQKEIPYFLPILTYEHRMDQDRSMVEQAEGREIQFDAYVLEQYKPYLQVPSNVSYRIYQLVQEIVEGSTSTKDKVQRIQNYLAKTYPYSLEVSPVPEGREFLDYFIFQEKKGYCTYFATAMTIFCRIAGVPARYVEGFKMSGAKDGRGAYTVSNEDAHAWCEVLTHPQEQVWAVADPSPTPAEERQRRQNEAALKEEENKGIDPSLALKNKKNKQPITDQEESEATVVEERMSKSTKIALGMLLSIVLYFMTRSVLHRKRYKKITKQQSSIPLYNYYLKRLSRIGLKKLDSMGDLEFIDIIPTGELKEKMEQLVEAVYEEYYGGKNAINLSKEEFYEYIEEYLKERQGKKRYYFERYLTFK